MEDVIHGGKNKAKTYKQPEFFREEKKFLWPSSVGIYSLICSLLKVEDSPKVLLIGSLPSESITGNICTLFFNSYRLCGMIAP